MAKEMLINVSEGEECRIALVENGRLEELYMERTSATSHVGNIYKGRVTNVEPSIQAAFIDFGLGRNGFLHISDLMPSYFGRHGDDIKESVGRKMARRDRPPIQRCLRRGDEIIVQIIKEGIGTKGPTLSTYLSIPGRILVMMPGMAKLGVSRKIEDEEERRRLRQILDSLKPPRECGFIIRTAGVGKSKAEIQKDLTYLTRLWLNIDKKIKTTPAPTELYTEGDLVTRTVRDVFTSDVTRIIVDNKDVARRIKDFIKIALPRTRNKLELFEGTVPLFHQFGIEREIEQMYSRHVPLPSGGSLVIDSTEAIVAIDVNSGKFRDHADAETTAFKTDMEAADEIPRQLRLRDLGGVIICDFIDLRYERHRRELEKLLHDNLSDDRAKTKMLRMSQFGIIEMTRQRMRPSLKRSIYFDCPHCKGAGLVKTPESMALDVMRRLAIAANDQRVSRIDLVVCPEVGFYLQNKKRSTLASLEQHWGKLIMIQTDPKLGMDAMKLELHDSRDGLVFLEELGMTPTLPAGAPAGRPSGHQQHRGGGRDQRPAQRDHRDQRDQRGRGGRNDQPQRGGRDQRPQQQRDQQRPQPVMAGPSDADEREDGFDMDRAEDAVEQREGEMFTGGEEIAPPPAPLDVAEAEEASPDPVAQRQPAQDEWREEQGAEEEGAEEETAGHKAAEDRPIAKSPPPAVTQPAARKQQEEQRDDSEERDQRDEPQESDQSRGRRSRGRGGRSRGGRARSQQQGHNAAPVAVPQNSQPPSPPPPAKQEPARQEQSEAGASGGKRRRGSRGGRGRGRGGNNAPAQVAVAARGNQAAPQPAPIVVKTGSTDRHLISDEPVLPQPVQRPRTYRDLDHIADDFD
jgi:ribonuclease E